MRLQAFESRLLRGNCDTPNYLVSQPVYKYFKKIANGDHISVWKSTGFPDESIKPPAAFKYNIYG